MPELTEHFGVERPQERFGVQKRTGETSTMRFAECWRTSHRPNKGTTALRKFLFVLREQAASVMLLARHHPSKLALRTSLSLWRVRSNRATHFRAILKNRSIVQKYYSLRAKA